MYLSIYLSIHVYTYINKYIYIYRECLYQLIYGAMMPVYTQHPIHPWSTEVGPLDRASQGEAPRLASRGAAGGSAGPGGFL